MVVGAARHDVEAASADGVGQRAGVLHDLVRIDLEVRTQGLAEGHRLGGDHMHQRPALQAREDGGVDLLGHVLVIGEDEAAARAAQGLVGGGGHHMGVGKGRGMGAARHQTREMGHIHQKHRAHRIGDGAKAREVPQARIGRAARDDELGLVLVGQSLHHVHVDALGVRRDAIADGLEPLAGHVDRGAVGQMPARRQIKAHEDVAGLEAGEEDRLIRLAAGIGLHIGEFAAEEFGGAIDRQLLGDVDELAAAIIAAARIALRIFVGHHRALRFEHGARDDVFRGDQLDLVPLATQFQVDGAGDLRVRLREGRGEECVRAHHNPDGFGRRNRRRVWRWRKKGLARPITRCSRPTPEAPCQ